MAASAIRLIGRELPGNGLAIGPMAIGTGQIRPMVARIVTADMAVLRSR